MSFKLPGRISASPLPALSQLLILFVCIFFPLVARAQTSEACEGYQAWRGQSNPRTDPDGSGNVAYPEANATYWNTLMTQPIGTVLLVRGRYPLARYMSIHTYDSQGNAIDGINDVSIAPDPGTNNPYREGAAQGTYTVRVVFGRGLGPNPPNTIYTGNQTTIRLTYRIYYPNVPDDLPAGAFDPVLPDITLGDTTWSSCPPRPIIVPETATVWGRESINEFVGSKPDVPVAARFLPQWGFSVTNPLTPYFPSEDNSYMWAVLSRDYLKPPYNFDFVVMRMKPPIFPDTQHGVPAYAPAQMRFWSVCTDEPLSTGVIRCIPDNEAINLNGYVTFVISDPSKRPSDAVMNQWGARWLPWGAIGADDHVYGLRGKQLTNESGVFYYNLILYRQTVADPNFAQSILNVSQLPSYRWKDAMGDYWPSIGYCTSAQFQKKGPGCILR